MASAAAAAVTIARSDADSPLLAAPYAIPPKPSASSEKSTPSARRCLFALECLIPFLALASPAPLRGAMTTCKRTLDPDHSGRTGRARHGDEICRGYNPPRT
jgi:hypothetical protein